MDHHRPRREFRHPIERRFAAALDRQRVVLFIDLAVIVDRAEVNRRLLFENLPFHETPDRYIWALAWALRWAWGSVKNVAARP
jgi:hypothetical protein